MNDLSKWRKVAKWITQTIVVAMELTKNTERMEIYVNVLDSVRQKLIWSAFSRNDGNLFSTSVCVILQCFYKISVKPTVLQKRIVNQLHENSVKSTFFLSTILLSIWKDISWTQCGKPGIYCQANLFRQII